MSSDTIGEGTLRTRDGRALPLTKTDVRAQIAGPIATVELRQVFRNDSAEPIEAVYSFPLPHEASVHRMELRIADRVVRAVVKEKEEARRTYERAKHEGRAATLLEQDEPSLFTLSVANVPPGAAIEVRLEYQEMVGFDAGEWRFVFPLVAPERYIEGVDSPAPAMATPAAAAQPGALPDSRADAARIAARRPPRLPSGQRSDEVTFQVDVRTDGDVESLRCVSHHCDVEPLEAGAFRVKLHPGAVANRDFVLTFRASQSGVRPHAWTSRTAGEDGTFLLVLSPPAADSPKTESIGAAGNLKALACGNCGGIVTDLSSLREIPGLGSVVKCTFCGALLAPSTEPPFIRANRPRDVVVLVDRSASMRGSMSQARRAIRAVLDSLAPGDGIQVVAFDHERSAFDGDGTRFVALAPEVVGQIDDFLSDLTARGGSELEAALQHVARLPVRESRTRAVVLVTDAAVGNEGRLLRRAPEILGPDRRLFVLGLGPAVDRRLVSKLARACGGASDTLLPNEDVEPVLARFARRVRDGGPVLTGISVAWGGPRVSDVYPSVVPDLYGGEPIRLLGRFAESGTCKLVITAQTVDGRAFRQEAEIELPDSSERAPGLARIWAKRKVDALLDRASRDPTATMRVKREVTELAVAFALVTPYTSLVAEDSEVVTTQKARRVEVASASPDGARGDSAPSRAQSATSAASGEPAEHRIAEHRIEEHDDGELDAALDDGAPRPTGAPPAVSPAPAGFAPHGAPRPPSPGAPPPSTFAAGAYAPTPPPPAMRASVSDSIGAPSSAARPEPLSFTGPPSSSPARGGPPAPQKAKSGGVFGAIKRALGVGEASSDEETRVDAVGFDEPTPLAPEGYGGSYDPEATLAAEAAARAARGHARPKQRPQATTAEPAGSEPYDASELEWLASRRTGELDLVFLVDATGSMGPYIAQVQSRLLELVAALRASPLCRSMRLGLVSYRDHPPQEHTYVSQVAALTDDIDAIEQAVRRLTASGGGDGPESVTDGLVDIVRLDWRPNAARAVAWFGDAPPHGVSPAGDAWPEGCPCGHHWFTQAESCREMGIAIYAVGCLPNLRHYAGGEDVYRTIAETSRGIYLPLSESSWLVPLIAGAAKTELDKQRVDEHVADVVAAHEDSLRRTDESERIRWITDVLRSEQVRPREVAGESPRGGPAPLVFRELRPGDVEGSLERLRRSGRLSV